VALMSKQLPESKTLGKVCFFICFKQASIQLRRQVMLRNDKTNMSSRQGVDNCTFELVFIPPKKVIVDEVQLISPSGVNYGFIGNRGTKCVVSVCIPRYIRSNNARPFSRSDIPFINEICKSLDDQLKRMFGNRFYTKLSSIEINITEKLMGKCSCENIIRLFNNALLHETDQNVNYVVKSKGFKYKPCINGLVSRTISNQWKLKCYDKMNQLGIVMEDRYVRVEFVLMARKINAIFHDKRDINNVLTKSGIDLLVKNFISLYRILIDDYVKEYLSYIQNVLLDELRCNNSPMETYCKYKEVIVDKEQMRRVIKLWYKERCLPDYSRQRIKELDEKYNLPCDTIKTLQSFRQACVW
jgi:hypothetical protein